MFHVQLPIQKLSKVSCSWFFSWFSSWLFIWLLRGKGGNLKTKAKCIVSFEIFEAWEATKYLPHINRSIAIVIKKVKDSSG